MAERRMFAKTIIDSDAFLDMPLSSQCLYFHLSMRADDEGFVNNAKKIMRMIGCNDDDIKMLVTKKFIIPFETGIIVIKHWKIHNYIRGDRLVATKYLDERNTLSYDENGAYTTAHVENDMLLQNPDDQSSKDKRKTAYANSSLPYSFTYKIRRAFDGINCPVCKCKMTTSNRNRIPTVQHNIPISIGGEHELENISVVCLSCNTSIRDKETGELNNSDVVYAWDEIIRLEKAGVDWFFDTNLIWDSQMSGTCQAHDSQMSAQVRLGKDSTDKVSKGKNKTVDDKQSEFDVFWACYPKKVGKEAARKAFKKVDVSIETLTDAVNNQKCTAQWQKDQGQFIPNPATWLNQRRWEDEIDALPELVAEQKKDDGWVYDPNASSWMDDIDD